MYGMGVYICMHGYKLSCVNEDCIMELGSIVLLKNTPSASSRKGGFYQVTTSQVEGRERDEKWNENEGIIKKRRVCSLLFYRNSSWFLWMCCYFAMKKSKCDVLVLATTITGAKKCLGKTQVAQHVVMMMLTMTCYTAIVMERTWKNVFSERKGMECILWLYEHIIVIKVRA